MKEDLNKFETISLMDFTEYCITDCTMFFDFKYDQEKQNLDIRITNEIGASYADDKLIDRKKNIQRERAFRLSRVEKFSFDKYSELVCDSILDIGHEKNEIWFLLGEGETLRVCTKEGFEISTLSLSSFKKELTQKKLINKTRSNLLRTYLLICCLWLVSCLSVWYFFCCYLHET